VNTPELSERARTTIARGSALVEDVAYIGLGLLLAGVVLALLAAAFLAFARAIAGWSIEEGMIDLLDRMLLILLIVELLYTVQVSFREHALVAEPFVLVGLISAIRRMLVVTAQLGEAKGRPASWSVAELAVLGLLVVALAMALVLLRKSGGARARRI
jgi:uncharacterized membrane protein (DUF373 family)